MLAPMGYLAYKSGWFPKALGALLVAGCGCYLADTLTAFLIPSLGNDIHSFITIPSGIAESGWSAICSRSA